MRIYWAFNQEETSQRQEMGDDYPVFNIVPADAWDAKEFGMNHSPLMLPWPSSSRSDWWSSSRTWSSLGVFMGLSP